MSRRRILLEQAAFAQEREAQAGVKMGCNQNAYDAASTRFVSEPIAVGTGDFSVEYYGNSFGSAGVRINTLSNAAQPVTYQQGTLMVYTGYLNTNGVGWVLFEGSAAADGLLLSWADTDLHRKFHLVITRQGTTVKAYINGSLKAAKEHSSVKDFPEFRFGLANASDIGLCRMYGFALGDTPVRTLFNNGDPAGYVLPAAFRNTTPELPFEPRTIEVNPGDTYYQPFYPAGFLRKNTIYEISYTVEVWDFQPAPYDTVGFASSGGYVGGANFWFTLSAARIGQVQRCCMRTADSPWIYLYGGSDNPASTARHLRVTIHSIRPVHCEAEYLPRNIVKRIPERTPVTVTGDGSYTWTGTDAPDLNIAKISRTLTLGRSYKITVTVSGYEAGAPFIVTDAYNNTSLPPSNGTHTVLMTHSREYPAHVLMYGGPNGSDRRLTLTLDAVEPADGIGGVWLDSALQLPLAGEYLPPLRESLGGNDLTASGAPQIIRARMATALVIPQDKTNGYANSIAVGVTWAEAARIELTNLVPQYTDGRCMIFCSKDSSGVGKSPYITYNTGDGPAVFTQLTQPCTALPALTVRQYQSGALNRMVFTLAPQTSAEQIHYGGWSDAAFSRPSSTISLRIFGRSGALLRDFVPAAAGSARWAKTPAPSCCFYDRVSGAYFQNAGAGKFTVESLKID